MESAERVSIGLKHDGKTFRCSGERALLKMLNKLKSVGYKFPVSLIGRLEERQ